MTYARGLMYWNDKENHQYEEFYQQFSEMIQAMCNSDFSKKISLGTPMSFINFIAFGLNTVNEELKEKVLSVKMFHSLLEALDLKEQTLLLITDAEGHITFLHTNIDKPHFKKEALIGQSLAVLFRDDFHEIDSRIKERGILKSLKVNMTYDKIGHVTIRLALPTIIHAFKGIAYVIKMPVKM